MPSNKPTTKKKMSVGVKSALIAAAGALIAALIAALLPNLFHHGSNRADVRIIDVKSAMVGSDLAIDLVLSNKSETPQAVVSITTELSQRGLRATIGRTIYSIYGTTITASGKIEGSVRSSQDGQVSHTIAGSFDQRESGSWELKFEVPLRDELEAGKSQWVLLALPNSVQAVQIGVHRPPENYELAKFLKGCGDMGIKIWLQHADGTESKYTGTIRF